MRPKMHQCCIRYHHYHDYKLSKFNVIFWLNFVMYTEIIKFPVHCWCCMDNDKFLDSPSNLFQKSLVNSTLTFVTSDYFKILNLSVIIVDQLHIVVSMVTVLMLSWIHNKEPCSLIYWDQILRAAYYHDYRENGSHGSI